MHESLPGAVDERLARLAPDQRAAATAPPGPILCVAPAGSGKTTTLVARIAWLVATGTTAERICAVTFNKRAADELSARVDAALEPLGLAPGAVRVKTFHALGREILADAGEPVEPLLDREATLRDLWPDIDRTALRRLDDAFSRLKLDLAVSAEQVAADPEPGPVARAFLAYEDALRDAGGLDFDDLVARALLVLEARPRVLAAWRLRCEQLLVDETQDVDRSQLRLALLLAAPANRIFLVGDDDQTIYGWRLADVRRVLGLAAALPGLTRLDLNVNYRCPAAVVHRAVRLVRLNEERFDKTIRAAGTAGGRLVLAADDADEPDRIRHVLDSWPKDGTRAVLARTNAELLPAAVVAIERSLQFAAPRLKLLTEDPRLDGLLARVPPDDGSPLLVRMQALARDPDLSAEGSRPGQFPPPDAPAKTVAAGSPDADRRGEPEELPIARPALVAALVSWASRYDTLASLRAAIHEQRRAIAELRVEDAPLTLATAHATKGLEFDHVAVIGLDEGRFPSGRSLRESAEPRRALEEERRLAYVAWTRARRSLTLVYDPAAPSRFMREAFDASELDPGRVARPPPRSGRLDPSVTARARPTPAPAP